VPRGIVFIPKTKGPGMTDRQRLQEWLALLDDAYLPCLVEVAAVLVADQHGMLADDWEYGEPW
jgi:hypothetical protein